MINCKALNNKGKPCSKSGKYAGYCYAHQRKGLTDWTGNENLRDKLLMACYLYNVADKDLEVYVDSVGSNKSLIGGHILAMKRKLQTDDPTFDEIANRCGHHLRQIRRCVKEASEKGINWDFVRETYNPILNAAV